MVIHDISRWPLIDDMEISNEKKKKKKKSMNMKTSTITTAVYTGLRNARQIPAQEEK